MHTTTAYVAVKTQSHSLLTAERECHQLQALATLLPGKEPLYQMTTGLSGLDSQPGRQGEEITLVSRKIYHNSRFPAYGLLTLQSEIGNDNNLWSELQFHSTESIKILQQHSHIDHYQYLSLLQQQNSSWREQPHSFHCRFY